jgi:hypothetical protein
MTARRLASLFCLAAALAIISGCNFLNPASRLYGKWKLDVDATIERAAGGNEFKKATLRAMWGLVGGDVTMEFRADGTGDMTGSGMLGSESKSGTWKLLSAESDKLKVEFTTDQGTHEQTLRMIGADTFEVDQKLPNDEVLTATFRRIIE